MIRQAFSRRILLCACVALLVATQRPLHAESAATRPVGATSFSGDWDSTFGPVHLEQVGETITGKYGMGDGEASISGVMKGKRFVFTYQEPAAAGEGWFELVGAGSRFSGKWKQNGMMIWMPWEGRRAGGIVPDSFLGLWRTDFGHMRLWQGVNGVHGVFELGGKSKIEGELNGRTLTFKYEQTDGEKGEGTFELAADGKSFAGTWKASKAGAPGKPAGYGGKWNGVRVVPEPGKTWLIVLESPWEANLADNEYSFGLMLRTFFARVPKVAVRHRFIHSEADLRRWCDELPYLAEPIVLHISSHGTKEGVTVGAKTIGGKVLAECLKDSGDIRLLHFGTCLVCSGEIPKQIQEALPAEARFPISGYVGKADWGGSAVVDFTYLDLVLSRGMSPGMAVEQTKKMVSFARERSGNGEAIAGAGLVIVDPNAIELERAAGK